MTAEISESAQDIAIGDAVAQFTQLPVFDAH
jgi:hypothetical protein